MTSASRAVSPARGAGRTRTPRPPWMRFPGWLSISELPVRLQGDCPPLTDDERTLRMLGRKSYTQEELDHAKTAIDQ
jgi:hypothetical protein